MSNTDDIVILSAVRTPMGALLGCFSALSASDLGAVAIRAAVERAGLKPEQINDVIMGNVLGAGQGQAPARQASRKAGLPDNVTALTINKMCGSGLKAVMLAHDALRAGSVDVAVVGGMESMTNAPHLVRVRGGIKYGHGELFDHMAIDGLEDAYQTRTPMGAFAEEAVTLYGFTREDQDAFAIESLKRAKHAGDSGIFDAEIVPVEVKTRKGVEAITLDEGPQRAMPEKIPGLKPAFKKDGTVTAGRVHHRPGRCHAEAARQDRMVGGRCRPVGNQRSLCRGHAHVHQGTGARPRQGQCQWRRLRAGPPHRRLGRAHPHHADSRPEGARRQEGRGQSVHRWRRSGGGGDRTVVTPPGCARGPARRAHPALRNVRLMRWRPSSGCGRSGSGSTPW